MKTTSVKQKVRIGVSIITTLAMSSALPALAGTSRFVEKGQVLATADFIPNGDKFFVDDKAKDGRGAYVAWNVPSIGRSGVCADADGASSPPSVCNYNFPEGRDIIWQLCVRDLNGSKPTVCAPIVRERT
ncbi:MAG: hypothetical protein HC852_02155 [Acaryochloridaceae cyanobacterium RU_4_10]|nr:hypothetical protein [Acaryochloridaceae cyanobacterium RU_4_10]